MREKIGQEWATNLRCQHKGLHELPHGLHVVGQLAHHLHHHALVQGGVGVHVPDLGVTVAETQSHHPLMDLLQRDERRLNKERFNQDKSPKAVLQFSYFVALFVTILPV